MSCLLFLWDIDLNVSINNGNLAESSSAGERKIHQIFQMKAEKITTSLSKRTGSTPKNGRVANSGFGIELSADGLGAIKIPPVSEKIHYHI